MLKKAGKIKLIKIHNHTLENIHAKNLMNFSIRRYVLRKVRGQ